MTQSIRIQRHPKQQQRLVTELVISRRTLKLTASTLQTPTKVAASVNLCKTIRRPGGHLPNPAFIVGGPEPPTIACTGIMVSQRTETNMQLASCTVTHHNRISRTTNIGAMNPTSIRRLRELKTKEEARVSEAPPPPTIDNKDWPKTMDSLRDYFTSVLGETKAPLAYVIRENEAVPPEADDLATNYDKPENEMIARMPHKDALDANLPTCIHDRSK
jgi:hypothetical protein